jgi:hypothetical protein
VPGARKEYKGKKKVTEAKCQEQGNNLREKRGEQKRSVRSKKRI